MGLDQYAYTVKDKHFKGKVKPPKKSKKTGYVQAEEFFYWRKLYPLENFMTDLYYRKGGTECFNCEFVEVTAKDLDALEKDSQNWDSIEFDEDDAVRLNEFISFARDHIKNGYHVMYSSWW